MENINDVFSEVKKCINQGNRYSDIKENLIGDYEELEKIYSYYYKKQSCERMKQQLKVFQDQQQENKTEEEPSYGGELCVQQQESKTYQVVASDLHGDIGTFLNILVQNKIIDLKDSCEIVDLKTLESYDTFESFKNKVQNEDDKIFLDARCVILPKFELNKDVKVTFNYLGDLIDEGKFSTECFYMMMMLMEKAKSCNNFEINYIAGNHEIANIMLETKDTKDQYLRQCTKYYCYSDDESEYLARSSNSNQTISEKLHNFQMGCVAEHSKKLIENGQMKLAHVDGNKVFIHANPSIDSVISFLNIGKKKDEINEIIENTIYSKQSEFLGKSKEDKLQYYLEQLNKLNTFFAEEVKKNNLCDFNFDTEFLIYISACMDDSVYGEDCYCPTFLPNFVYFVGHDSRAGLEYTLEGSKLYCLDGHGIKSERRFVKIVGDEIYRNSVESNEFQEKYDTLQQQFNALENEIAEKCKQDSLSKQSKEVEDADAKMSSAQKATKKDTTTLLETKSLLENANAETDRRCMLKKEIDVLQCNTKTEFY